MGKIAPATNWPPKNKYQQNSFWVNWTQICASHAHACSYLTTLNIPLYIYISFFIQAWVKERSCNSFETRWMWYMIMCEGIRRDDNFTTPPGDQFAIEYLDWYHVSNTPHVLDTWGVFRQGRRHGRGYKNFWTHLLPTWDMKQNIAQFLFCNYDV